MKRILLFLIILAFVFFTKGLDAQTKYVAVRTGEWTSSSTWSPSGVPDESDTAVIGNGYTVSLTPITFGWWIVLRDSFGVAKLIVQDSSELYLKDVYTFWNGPTLSKLVVKDSLIVNGTIRGTLIGSFPSLTDGLSPLYFSKSLTGKGNFTIVSLRSNNSNVIIEEDADLSFQYCFITVRGNDTITNYGKIVTDYMIRAERSNSTWINKANSFVSVGYTMMDGGKLVCNEINNTVKYSPIYGNVQIKIPEDTIYYNLEIAGSDTTILNAPYIYVNNDFSILASTFNSLSNKIYLKGNWKNLGAFIGDNSTVIFNGVQDQSITSSAYETFENLILNNPSNKIILNTDIIVNDTLNLNSIVYGPNYAVTIGQNLTNPGKLIFNSGKIIGKLKRWVNASTLSYLYPIGSDDFNTFVNITFSNLESGGIASFQFVDTMPGSYGLPLIDNSGDTAVNPFNDGFWVADTAQGFKLGANTYSITLQGEIFNAFTINDSTKIIVRPHQDSLWRFDGSQGVNDPANYHVSRIDLDSFPWHFAFADTTHCTPPTLTYINGPEDVCRGETGISYNTDTSQTYIYFWSVNGGSIVSNNGDTVSINWENNGQYGKVTVYAQNSCTFGNTLTKIVRVNSIPPEDIYGPLSVPQQADSVLYYIDALPNYSYITTIIGNANIDSVSTNNDSIWVTFTIPGTDTIQFIAQYNNGCNADTAKFPVYVYDVINSIQSGSWYDPNTWDCNCTPLSSDNVRINPGHIVYIDIYNYNGITYYSYDINNVVIRKNGVLSRDDGVLIIAGDIINDGILEYNGENLFLDGYNKLLDGIGIFNADTVELVGSRMIGTNAKLIFNSNIKLNNNTLDNQGKIFVNGSILASTNGTFINNKRASLFIKNDLLISGGNLVADSIDNTVIYDGNTQYVIPVSPSSQGYYNLTIAGNGTKTADGYLVVLGDFSIVDSGIFDISNNTIELYHNWYEYSAAADPFVEGTGLVLFNGQGNQYIYAPNGETFYDLKVGQNSILNIMPNQHFTVSNGLYVDGLIKMRMQNANDTLPSFIYNNNIVYGSNGAIETDLFINSKTWHEISPAILGLKSNVFTSLANGGFNPNFYWYDESVDLDNDPNSAPANPFDASYLVDGWQYAHNGSSNNSIDLNLNTGYMFYIDRDTVFEMKGKVADVNVNFDTTLSYTSNDPYSGDTLPNFYDGWNLLGNPYTAYLSVDSILNNGTNIDNGVYIWDDENEQYAGYQNGFRIFSGNLGNIIPPLQGFFIRANDIGASVQIRPEYRTHGKQQYLKSFNPYKRNAIKIGFNVNNKTEYFATYFYPLASLDYNGKYDLLYLKATNSENPFIYSIKNNQPIALLSLPDSLIGNAVIPLFIETSVNGIHKIKVDYINGFDNSFVLLKDLKTESLTNIRDQKEITFSYNSNDDKHRFDILIIQNNPPFVNNLIPIVSAYEDSLFTFSFNGYFDDNDIFDTLKIMLIDLPEWLNFDGETVSGIPKQENIGIDSITVIAYDTFNEQAEQKLILNVINTNDPPVINFHLDSIITYTYDTLIYQLPNNLFSDPDPDDQLSIFFDNLPQWLQFDSRTQTLWGYPTIDYVGKYSINIIAQDLAGEKVSTNLKIEVLDKYGTEPVIVYPIPANEVINVLIRQPAERNIIKIYDINGRLFKNLDVYSDFTEINISDLQPGQYIMHVISESLDYKIRFTKF